MKTPFTLEQFLDVFKNYNITVWPTQIILYVLGLSAIILIFRKHRLSDRIINSILAFFWLWIGVVYHIAFFTAINKAAYLFGVLFIIQSVIFLVMGVFRESIGYQYKKDIYSVTGCVFLCYALIIYPVLGHFLGHIYPYSPTFGLPCPTVIFTFGILLFAGKRISYAVLIIPALWSFLGFSAAISFGISEDIGLLSAGLIGIAMIIAKNNGYKAAKHAT
jgi:hypothetical protein